LFVVGLYFIIIQGQNQYWHNRMCKGFVLSDNTEQDLPIESDMTLRSREYLLIFY